MQKKARSAQTSKNLRDKTKKHLQERDALVNPSLSQLDSRELVHELQAELEVQEGELRLSREELEAERARYYSLYEFAPVGYLSLDQHGLIRKVNLTAAALLGGERTAQVDMPLKDFVHPEDQPAFSRMLSEVFMGKGTAFCEVRLGRVTPVSFHVCIEGRLAPDGHSYLALMQNVTIRKQLERKLTESEHHYKTLANSGQALIWTSTPDKLFDYFNEPWLTFTGRTLEQELGYGWIEGIHPEDHARCLNIYATAFEQREPYSIDYRLRHFSGAYRWIVSQGTPRYDSTGTFLGYIGHCLDIHANRTAQELLHRSEKRLRLAQESAKAGTWEWDMATGKNIWTNDVWKLYMMDPEGAEPSYETWLESIHPGDRQQTAAAVREALASGKDLYAEWRVKTSDGCERWLMSRGQPQRDAKGNVTSYLGIVMDITERKQTENQLLLAKAQAEAANQAKSEFLANMSHEIRTPLNGVMGMLQVLQMSNLGSEERTYTDLALTSATRLLNLLSDILDFSKMEAGMMTLHSEEFHLATIFTSVEETFRGNLRNKALELTFSLDSSVPGVLKGDCARLRQMLFNLVGNALKFTPSGSVQVTAWATPLQCSPAKLQLFIAVKDTGIGISPDKLKPIFERFEQVGSGMTRQQQGSGLGLAIVKRIVKLMGGNIVVESVLGGGSTFTVNVLLDAPSIGGSTGETVRPTGMERPKTTSLSLLCAEDDPINMQVLQTMLLRLGHEVVTASNGREVLAALHRQDFDAILMDIKMPEMDGLEATQAIRTSPELSARSSIPIIALTAFAMHGDREKFLMAGMDNFIAKPVQIEELQKLLAQIATKSN